MVDHLFNPARDAVAGLDAPHILRNPSSAPHMIGTVHPHIRFFWYHPAFGSGLPFPIPRENSILVKYRNSRGISGRLPHEIPLSKATDLVSPEIVDLDFPFTKLSDFHLYGPIALNSVPIQDLDPQLSNRFDAAPTVLMSIGTRFVHTQAQVRAILRGFLTALDLEMRVLWKLPHHSLFKDIIGELLPGAEDKEQFMIVDWIPVDPFSIMTQECP